MLRDAKLLRVFWVVLGDDMNVKRGKREGFMPLLPVLFANMYTKIIVFLAQPIFQGGDKPP